MCGRVAVPQSVDIFTALDLILKEKEHPIDINVPPTASVPVISDANPKELSYKRWSLIPPFAQPDPKSGKPLVKLSTFNARYDKLLNSNIWKPLVGKRHCLVVVNGYYEWEELDEWADDKHKKKKKQPHFIKQKGEDLTLLAGLWSDWVNKGTGEIISSCTVITHEAVAAWGKIHDRMPAFVTREDSKIWLDSEIPVQDRLKVIQPVGEDFLESVKIDTVGDIQEFEQKVLK
ncbi:SOS response-associated peptidase [Desertivirga arenae]|uniref:SOS response-associated peptidase n=1 Tax=Desertivirga arenae TaxID=2810309 RepID=UPI001A95B62C|nr:SOS response-associated peptidase [Pedobacter sp. SYSU D00823]